MRLCLDFRIVLAVGVILQFVAGNTLREQQTFDDILADKIRENEARDGNVHGHITAVNEAHREAAKRQAIPATGALEERIEAVNEASSIELFEGDIELGPGDLIQDIGKRNIIVAPSRKWPNEPVPYYVPPNMDYVRPKIQEAINEFKKRTCVRFKEVDGSYQGNHIRFSNKGGCSSSVGRRNDGKGQVLHIGKGCEVSGVIIHEMMHTLGIYHEQSRPDRDQYVEILWNNIRDGKEHNFKTYSHGKLDSLGLPYDTSSIMHYDRYLFSKNRRLPTILAKGRPWVRLGGQVRGTLTDNDAKEINSLFGC